ncbi:sigma-E factor negative regulatory protein [Halorhodospira abdelmalekii]|uniref:sigma-E factor negative regulatory protein n=1 Tax=Halorhodospira abdelmalekii TaxID=421629 RepID=UPI001905D4BA|nr:sigma-E factor negative regulatory protein [Halorhodospira abdelmalekii]
MSSIVDSQGQSGEQDSLGEQLSAWVDGELSREEAAFLLRRLDRDPQLRARLARYYLMRDALQRRLPPQPRTDLAERVRQTIADEPPLPRPAAGVAGAGGWRRAALGSALAASVAVVTAVWWQGGWQESGEGAPLPGEDAHVTASEREHSQPDGGSEGLAAREVAADAPGQQRTEPARTADTPVPGHWRVEGGSMAVGGGFGFGGEAWSFAPAHGEWPFAQSGGGGGQELELREQRWRMPAAGWSEWTIDPSRFDRAQPAPLEESLQPVHRSELGEPLP